ncbi:MAG: trigger factor [bacterium]|nr:trigger factor [bacterium]
MIKREITKLPNSELEIKVSVPWDDWKKFLDDAVSELSKDLKISGFRPGKAPRNIVEQKIGKEHILEHAAEKAIQKTYAEIVSEEKPDVIGAPKAEILKLVESNDLEYKITTAVIPEVKLKPWKDGIKEINKKFQDFKIEIKDEEIDKEVNKIAESRAKLVTVNREAKKGDCVFVDFGVSMRGVPIENGSSKNHPVILGKGVFIPGFEDNLLGMKEKEEKKFSLKFPNEYHEKNLAGKSADFEVEINLIQERQIPEINDEFAKSLGKFENLENLKNSVRDGIKKDKESEYKEKRRSEFIEELIKLSEIDLPEILVKSEIKKMLGDFEIQLSQMGTTMNDFLEKMSAKGGAASGGEKTREDLEKDWKPQAEKRVKATLILEEIAKEREVKVENEKVEEEMNKTLGHHENHKDAEQNIDMERLYNYTKGILVNEEIFEYLENL